MTVRPVHTYQNLEIYVDQNPIGGYRGKCGTLVIGHKKLKSFKDWTKKDLQNLAWLTNSILKIRESENITNNLIYGREDDSHHFQLAFVPYPKCNWIEKIKGLFHTIFGAPTLSSTKYDEIYKFYSSKSFLKTSKGVNSTSKNPDVFCKDKVLDEQRVAKINLKGVDYTIANDRTPKGRTIDDQHLLVIPEKDEGHVDGSKVANSKRYHLFLIAQRAMEVLKSVSPSKTFLYIERNGELLQGVKHKHANIIGIEKFPESFFEKVIAFFRQILPGRLSDNDLKIRNNAFHRIAWNITP